MNNRLIESLTVGRLRKPHAEARETAVVRGLCCTKVTKLAWQAPTDESSVKPIRPEAYLIAQGIDPIVAASHYNLTSSPLCRLPDELLLDIMELVDPAGLQCLRRVSRIFLRLFGSSKFKSAHFIIPRSHYFRTPPWTEHHAGTHTGCPGMKELSALLRKDRFCSRCLQVRQFGRKHKQFRALVDKQLYCSGCKKKHPAALFSASQRRMNWRWWKSSTRVCIAHEGYIRACQHIVIRWSDIESWVAQNGFVDTEEHTILIPWTPICQERCHSFQYGRSCRWLTHDGINLNVWKRPGCHISVGIIWTAHVATLPEALAAPTAETMRQILRSTYQDAGQFQVPYLSANDSLLMAAVDPNKCSCLQYTGYDKLDWQLSPAMDAEDSCRTDPAWNLFSQTGIRRWCPCHRISFASPITKDGCSAWSQLSFFGTISQCVCTAIEIDHHRTFEFGFDQEAPHGPSAGWYRVLDPESYGLNMDHGSRHVLWCADESCGNYYRLSYTDRFRHVL